MPDLHPTLNRKLKMRSSAYFMAAKAKFSCIFSRQPGVGKKLRIGQMSRIRSGGKQIKLSEPGMDSAEKNHSHPQIFGGGGGLKLFFDALAGRGLHFRRCRQLGFPLFFGGAVGLSLQGSGNPQDFTGAMFRQCQFFPRASKDNLPRALSRSSIPANLNPVRVFQNHQRLTARPGGRQ